MIHNDWKCQITRNSEKNCFKFFQTSANFLRLLLNLEKKSKVTVGFSMVGSAYILALRFFSALCEAKFCESHSIFKFPGTSPNFLKTLADPRKKILSIHRFSMKNTTLILALRFLRSIRTFPLNSLSACSLTRKTKK